MTLGVVFVNYFSADLITERVDAYAGADIEAIVVDNSGEYRGPGRIVGNGCNIGFGLACNVGVEALGGAVETVVLHNPDVSPTLELLDTIAQRVSEPGVGLVAPALDTPEGVVRNGYSYPRLAAELIAGDPGRTSRPSSEHRGRRSAAGRRVLRRVSRSLSRTPRFGSAALVAVDVAAFRSIGGFDDRFILYGEDLDLWHRMSESGQATVFANDLTAFHERGTGSPASRETRELLRFAGIQLFTQIHHGRRWKLFRAVHERSLGSVADDNRIGQLLQREWSDDSDPIETSRALRALFLDGVMAEPASNGGHQPNTLVEHTGERS